MTGAKNREELYQAFEMLYPVLQGKQYGVVLASIFALMLMTYMLDFRHVPLH